MPQSLSLQELIAKRVEFYSKEGVDSAERKALVDAIVKRTKGVRVHRVMCRLQPRKVCGLAFHSFHFRDGGGFQDVSEAQQKMIEAAAQPLGLMLEFKINRKLGFKHWTYRAECNGNTLNHAIVVHNYQLLHPPGNRYHKTRKRILSPETLAQITKWLKI